MVESRVSPPRIPDVTLWCEVGSTRTERAKTLLERAGARVSIRDLVTSPPSIDELEELLAWLARGPGSRPGRPPADPRDLAGALAFRELGADERRGAPLLRALAARPALIERPIAIAIERRSAIVARPPELALGLLCPEMPAGMTEGDLVRAAIQGRPLA